MTLAGMFHKPDPARMVAETVTALDHLTAARDAFARAARECDDDEGRGIIERAAMDAHELHRWFRDEWNGGTA